MKATFTVGKIHRKKSQKTFSQLVKDSWEFFFILHKILKMRHFLEDFGPF